MREEYPDGFEGGIGRDGLPVDAVDKEWMDFVRSSPSEVAEGVPASLTIPAVPIAGSSLTAAKVRLVDRMWIGLMLFAGVGIGGAATYEYVRLYRWMSAPAGLDEQELSALETAQGVSMGITIVLLTGLGATLAATMVWMRAASQDIDRDNVTGRRWSSGWTIGAWFVPVANPILPSIVLREIDRISASELPERWSGSWRTRGAPAGATYRWWWWPMLLVALVTCMVARSAIDVDLLDSNDLVRGDQMIAIWLVSGQFVSASALIARNHLRAISRRFVVAGDQG